MFVLVSSQSAAGPAYNGRPVTEADPPHPVSWYGRSKLEGENAIASEFSGPWCVIRPCVVYGRGDTGLLELFRVVEKGIAPILAGGHRRLQLIEVRDLARVLVATANRPDLAARRGFAATDVVSMGQLAREIAALRSPPARAVPIPALAIRAAGILESLRQWVTGRPRPFNRDKACEILQPDWLCDARPMLRDLLGTEMSSQSGLDGDFTGCSVPSLMPWKEGLRELCRCYVLDQWLRQNNWAV